MALAVGLGLAAFAMEADGQSGTRLVWPDAGNSPDDRARAALPQQVVAFNLSPVSHEAARAGLPAADRFPPQGNTIAFMSETVRVHDLVDVTLTRSPNEQQAGIEYYHYCLWVEYSAADIPPPEPGYISSRLMVDIFWNGRDLGNHRDDKVEIETLMLPSNKGDFRQLHCQSGSDIDGQAPQSVSFYFTRPFSLFPFRAY